MKKIILFLLIPMFLFLGLQPAAAADDGLDNEYHKDAMRKLIEMKILKGYPTEDGEIDYKPEKAVTRAEFASFIIRALDKEDIPVITTTKKFSDVKPGIWYYNVVHQAAQLNIVNGRSETTFAPNDTVSRKEIASMLNNAFEYKGIIIPEADISGFKDEPKETDYSYLSLQRMVYAGILAGSNNGLDPNGASSRAMTSAFLVRMLSTLESPPPAKYYVGSATADKITKDKEYTSFAAAKEAATGKNNVVWKNNKIALINGGQVTNNYTAASLIMYKKDLKEVVIGVESGTPVEYLGFNENSIHVKFGSKDGYVRIEDALMIPSVQVKGNSYYTVDDGRLYHKAYNALKKEHHKAYQYGRSSSAMPEGTYHSDNGHTFVSAEDGKKYEVYQYFNMLPLYTKTSYTAEELNQYVKDHKPQEVESTILETMGGKFKEVESKYNINAMYLMAHAILESKWGTSDIALNEKNLFGIGAVDGFGTADGFTSYEQGVDALAIRLTKPNDGFFTEGWRYQGAFLGNKDLGLNVFYATDPYWGQKIAGQMHRMDHELGGNERNKYPIAITLTKDVKVRNSTTVDNSATGNFLYFLAKTGTPVIVLDTIQTKNEGIWYEIHPKNTDEKTYVYSHGGPEVYGIKNMEIIPLAD